jgi:hypothetical protein
VPAEKLALVADRAAAVRRRRRLARRAHRRSAPMLIRGRGDVPICEAGNERPPRA